MGGGVGRGSREKGGSPRPDAQAPARHSRLTTTTHTRPPQTPYDQNQINIRILSYPQFVAWATNGASGRARPLGMGMCACVVSVPLTHLVPFASFAPTNHAGGQGPGAVVHPTHDNAALQGLVRRLCQVTGAVATFQEAAEQAFTTQGANPVRFRAMNGPPAAPVVAAPPALPAPVVAPAAAAAAGSDDEDSVGGGTSGGESEDEEEDEDEDEDGDSSSDYNPDEV